MRPEDGHKQSGDVRLRLLLEAFGPWDVGIQINEVKGHDFGE